MAIMLMDENERNFYEEELNELEENLMTPVKTEKDREEDLIKFLVSEPKTAKSIQTIVDVEEYLEGLYNKLK